MVMNIAFGDFVAAGTATAARIEFINMVVEHLADQGVMDPSLVYEPPFTDIAPMAWNSSSTTKMSRNSL